MPKFELNERAELLKCSDECSKLFGVPTEELTGRRLDEFVTLDSGPRMLLALLDAYRDRPVKKIPLTIIKPNRRQVKVTVSLKAEIDPKVRHITRLLGEFEYSENK